MELLQNTIRDWIQTTPLFSFLDEREQKRLAQCLQTISAEPGQEIVSPALNDAALYTVYSGNVRIYSTDESGREIVLQNLRKGDCFGEESLLNDLPIQLTARATSPVILFRLSREDFQTISQTNTEIRWWLKRHLSQKQMTGILISSPLFANLDSTEIRELLNQIRIEKFSANQKLFNTGDASDRIFLLLKGEVALIREENETSIQPLSPGTLFGDGEILFDVPRRQSALALTDVETATISRETLKEALAIPDPPKDAPEPLPAQPTQHKSNKQAELEPARKPRTKRVHWHWLSAFPWVEQLDETDCGAACMAMVCQWYGSTIPIPKMRQLCNVRREGTSLHSLSQAAQTLGFQAQALETGIDFITSKPLPAILHWTGNHYVVLFRIEESGFHIADPATGITKLTRREFEQNWTGLALILKPENLQTSSFRESSWWSRFAPIIHPHRYRLARVFAAAAAFHLAGLAAPLLTQILIDDIIPSAQAPAIALLVSALLCVTILQASMGILRDWTLLYIINRMDLSLLQLFLRHLMRLPIEFFHLRRAGDIIARMEESMKIRNMLSQTVIQLVLDAIMFTVFLTAILIYSWKLSIVALATFPILAALALLTAPLFRRLSNQIFQADASQQSYMFEALSNISTIKAHTAEPHARSKWRSLFFKLIRRMTESHKLSIEVGTMGDAMLTASQALVLGAGAWLVTRGELTLGGLVAFSALAANVTGPFFRFLRFYDQYQDFSVAVEKLRDVLDTDPEPQPSNPIALPVQEPWHIRVENVSFRYDPHAPDVLHGLDFTLLSGQISAIVGRSGSGKSTIASLLCRFHQPQHGNILLNTTPIQNFSLTPYRSHCAIVLQEPSLMSGTIRDNITLGSPEYDNAQVEEAAFLAGAHEFIEELPLGYQTIIGERGSSLSGGQGQRIAIARALIRRPRLLILDEATSSLDQESESLIQHNLSHLAQGRILLVISHRLASIRHADQILVMDQGAIAERGTHRELIAKQGLYYYLHRQSLGF